MRSQLERQLAHLLVRGVCGRVCAVEVMLEGKGVQSAGDADSQCWVVCWAWGVMVWDLRTPHAHGLQLYAAIQSKHL